MDPDEYQLTKTELLVIFLVMGCALGLLGLLVWLGPSNAPARPQATLTCSQGSPTARWSKSSGSELGCGDERWTRFACATGSHEQISLRRNGEIWAHCAPGSRLPVVSSQFP